MIVMAEIMKAIAASLIVNKIKTTASPTSSPTTATPTTPINETPTTASPMSGHTTTGHTMSSRNVAAVTWCGHGSIFTSTA